MICDCFTLKTWSHKFGKFSKKMTFYNLYTVIKGNQENRFTELGLLTLTVLLALICLSIVWIIIFLLFLFRNILTCRSHFGVLFSFWCNTFLLYTFRNLRSPVSMQPLYTDAKTTLFNLVLYCCATGIAQIIWVGKQHFPISLWLRIWTLVEIQ